MTSNPNTRHSIWKKANPCPICGSNDLLYWISKFPDGADGGCISCSECDYDGPKVRVRPMQRYDDSNLLKAITEWNKIEGKVCND